MGREHTEPKSREETEREQEVRKLKHGVRGVWWHVREYGDHGETPASNKTIRFKCQT